MVSTFKDEKYIGTKLSDDVILDTFHCENAGIISYRGHRISDYAEVMVHMTDACPELDVHFSLLGSMYGQSDVGKYGKKIWISQRIFKSEFLSEMLTNGTVRFELVEALTIFKDFLRRISEIHALGITHGYLTPDYVFLTNGNLMSVAGAGLFRNANPSSLSWNCFSMELQDLEPVLRDIYACAAIFLALLGGYDAWIAFAKNCVLPSSVMKMPLLRQSLESALCLRQKRYTDILAFSKDIEAALFIADQSQLEHHVSELIAYKSAVTRLLDLKKDLFEGINTDDSACFWSSLNRLDEDVKPDFLSSITSMNAIEPRDDDDDEKTIVTSLPKSVQQLRRMRYNEALCNDDFEDGPTRLISRDNIRVYHRKILAQRSAAGEMLDAETLKAKKLEAAAERIRKSDIKVRVLKIRPMTDDTLAIAECDTVRDMPPVTLLKSVLPKDRLKENTVILDRKNVPQKTVKTMKRSEYQRIVKKHNMLRRWLTILLFTAIVLLLFVAVVVVFVMREC